MKKTSKTKVVVSSSSRSSRVQQSYHSTSLYNVNYAFQGFESNKYFTSDRFIELNQHWLRSDGKALKGFGLEIEVECSKINDSNLLSIVLKDLILKQFPKDLYKFQRDGSLGGNSATEIITQVMTKEFIRNHYPHFKAMWSDFELFGIDAYTSGRCGMHCNISNALFGKSVEKLEDSIKKFYYIINKHYDLMKRVFFRNPNASEGYYRRMNCSSKDYVKHLNLSNADCSHGVCINLGHYNEGRIELRLVGGQKNYASFRNTMECVFHIVQKSQEISWKDLDDLSIIFNGCNKYVFDRIKMFPSYFTTQQLVDIQDSMNDEDFI
jgi:hypothetical protein